MKSDAHWRAKKAFAFLNHTYSIIHMRNWMPIPRFASELFTVTIQTYRLTSIFDMEKIKWYLLALIKRKWEAIGDFLKICLTLFRSDDQVWFVVFVHRAFRAQIGFFIALSRFTHNQNIFFMPLIRTVKMANIAKTVRQSQNNLYDRWEDQLPSFPEENFQYLFQLKIKCVYSLIYFQTSRLLCGMHMAHGSKAYFAAMNTLHEQSRYICRFVCVSVFVIHPSK